MATRIGMVIGHIAPGGTLRMVQIKSQIGWCSKCGAYRALENVRKWPGGDFSIGECVARDCHNTISASSVRPPEDAA